MSDLEELEHEHATEEAYWRNLAGAGATQEELADERRRLREYHREQNELSAVRHARQYRAPPQKSKSFFTVADLERMAERGRQETARQRARDAAAAAEAAAAPPVPSSSTTSALTPAKPQLRLFKWASPEEEEEEEEPDVDWLIGKPRRQKQRRPLSPSPSPQPPASSSTTTTTMTTSLPPPPSPRRYESHGQPRPWADVSSDDDDDEGGETAPPPPPATTKPSEKKRERLSSSESTTASESSVKRARIPVVAVDVDVGSPALPSGDDDDDGTRVPAPPPPTQADLSRRMVALTEHWIESAANAVEVRGAGGRSEQTRVFNVYAERANALTRALAALQHLEPLVSNFHMQSDHRTYCLLRAYTVLNGAHASDTVLRCEPLLNTMRWLQRPRRLPLPQMFVRFRLLESQADVAQGLRWPLLVLRRGALIDSPVRLLAGDEFDVRTEWLESLRATAPLAIQYDAGTEEDLVRIRGAQVALVPRISLGELSKPVVAGVPKVTAVVVEMIELRSPAQSVPPPLRTTASTTTTSTPKSSFSSDTGWLSKREK